jgi:transcription elongation factor GreA
MMMMATALLGRIEFDSSIEPMSETRELSRETYDRLHAELEELTGAGRIDIANKIEAARALGDLSENGDYHAAKDQQGKMEARIRQIQGILQDAVVVEAGPGDGTVVVGSIVGIDFGGGDVEKYLVGHIEERHDTYDVLSPESPLGSSLMGKKPGDKASYEVKGNTIDVTISSVE